MPSASPGRAGQTARRRGSWCTNNRLDIPGSIIDSSSDKLIYWASRNPENPANRNAFETPGTFCSSVYDQAPGGDRGRVCVCYSGEKYPPLHELFNKAAKASCRNIVEIAFWETKQN